MAQKKVKQFGNFVVTHDEKGGFVAIKAVVGFWQLRFRNDHLMFGTLLRFCKDNSMDRYFEHLFSIWYMMTQGLPDGKCLEDIANACEGWYKRLNNDSLSIGEEDDEEVLNEVVLGEQIKEELLKENGSD